MDRQGIRGKSTADRAARRAYGKRWPAKSPFVRRRAATERFATGRFPAPNSEAASARRQSGGARRLRNHGHELFWSPPRSDLGRRQHSHRDLPRHLEFAAGSRKHRRQDRHLPFAAPHRRFRRSRRAMAGTAGALSPHFPSGGLGRSRCRASGAAGPGRGLLACPGRQSLPESGTFARQPVVGAVAEAAGRPARASRRSPREPGVAPQICR